MILVIGEELLSINEKFNDILILPFDLTYLKKRAIRGQLFIRGNLVDIQLS